MIFERRLKCFNTIVGIEEFIKITNGVEITECSEIIELDYRDYLINIDINDYFKNEIKRIK